MPSHRVTYITPPTVVLTVIASLISCSDLGTLPTAVYVPPSDCGRFELFYPADTVGDFYYITGARVFPLDKLTRNGITDVFYCNTLRGQLAFSVQTEYRRLTQKELSLFPGIKTDPIVGEIVNPIKWTNASMQFDRDIRYQGQVIPAGDNVLDWATIRVPSFYFPLTISPFGIEEIHMSPNDFTLPNGEYHLVTSWETYDNKVITDTVDFRVLMQ